MAHDYRELLRVATRRERYHGFLDTAGERAQRRYDQAYDRACNRFAYKALKLEPNADALIAQVRAELDSDVVAGESQWAVDLLIQTLPIAIRHHARRHPALRFMLHRGLPALAIILIAGYLWLRFSTMVTIDKPITTPQGFQQYAAAAERAARYERWSSPGSGNLLEMLRVIPTEPTPSENDAAKSFAKITLERRAILSGTSQICGMLPHGRGSLSPEELDLIITVAHTVRSKDIAWTNPNEVIDSTLRAAYPCRANP